MTIEYTDYDHKHLCWGRCISWSAVIAGAFVAVGLGFLFNLFSLATGLSAFTVDKDGQAALALGGYIALLIGGFITMYIAGWVAGYLGSYLTRNVSYYNRRLGTIYGFVTWSLALVLMIIVMASINEFIDTVQDSMLGSSAPTTRTAMTGAADRISMGPVGSDRGDRADRTSSTDRTERATNERADRGDRAVAEREKTDQSKPGIEATPTEEKATNIVGVVLFSMFLVFFVGAVAAAFGGMMGYRPRNDQDEVIDETPKRKRQSS